VLAKLQIMWSDSPTFTLGTNIVECPLSTRPQTR